jgi:hypothetical protein
MTRAEESETSHLVALDLREKSIYSCIVKVNYST